MRIVLRLRNEIDEINMSKEIYKLITLYPQQGNETKFLLIKLKENLIRFVQVKQEKLKQQQQPFGIYARTYANK